MTKIFLVFTGMSRLGCVYSIYIDSGKFSLLEIVKINNWAQVVSVVTGVPASIAFSPAAKTMKNLKNCNTEEGLNRYLFVDNVRRISLQSNNNFSFYCHKTYTKDTKNYLCVLQPKKTRSNCLCFSQSSFAQNCRTC